MNLTPSMYKKNLMRHGTYAGQSKKNQADTIVETTWYEDLATRTCYLYDYYHDNEPLKLDDLHPDERIQVPVDIKYIVNSSQTFAKDAVTYHIMFKPSEEGRDDLVSYYKECFIDRYDATFPVGLYIAIPDSKGIYNRWLVVDKANYNDPQFPTYEVLRCDKIFEWVYGGYKHRCPGVLRSQNSYNSGVWVDYMFESPEDQQKAILPLNRMTENLFYNLRMIIDNRVLTEPRTWRITKVNRIAPNGNVMLTFAQDQFDAHRDYIEYEDEEKKKVIGQWADYYTNGGVIPQEETEPDTSIYCEVTTTGVKPTLKLNDRYKLFTVKFYRQGESINFKRGTWSFSMVDPEKKINTKLFDPSTLLSIKYPSDDPKLQDNQIKIKFIGDITYVDWTLVVTYTESETGHDLSNSLEVNITRL